MIGGDSFARLYRILRSDVIKFGYAAGWFGRFHGEDVRPTHQQRPVLEDINAAAVRGEPYYGAAKSGQGTGKTNLESLVATWRAFRSFGAPSYVTAPTMRQVKDVFIKEARLMLDRGDPAIKRLFEVQSTRIIIGGMKDWGVIGLSATRPENFQGYHHPNMSFFADEASGIPKEIMETIFGTLTNPDRLFLACGNPNTRDCAFFEFFHRLRDRFRTYTMNAEESPIVDPANIDRMREQYGRDSDIYRIRVLGEFPLSDPKCVISSDDLEACSKNDPVACVAGQVLDLMPEGMARKQFGIDFARYGNDRSVIMRRSGLAVVEAVSYSHTEPSDVVAKAFEMQRRAGWTDAEAHYIADADGMGQGVMSRFYEGGKQIFEFHNAGVAYRSDVYADAMTEALFFLKDLVETRKVYIPPDPVLIKELSSRQYGAADGIKGKGRLKIETKEIYCHRTGESSPDRADACAMVFYPYAFGTTHILVRQKRGRTAGNRRAA